MLAVQGPGDEGSRFSLRGVEEISAGEYRQLAEVIAKIQLLGHSFEYLLVERNYVELRSAWKFVAVVRSLGRDFGIPDHDYVRNAIFVPLLNWLTSAVLYVDHSGIAIKRQFGADSSQFQRFEATRHDQFDKRVGYRFCYRLRNYFIHNQAPVLHIDVDRPDRLGITSNLNQIARLRLSRDSLLDWAGWGPVAADLKGMSPAFDFHPLAAEAMDGYREIYDEVFDLNLEEVLRRVGPLRDAVQRVGPLEDREGPILLRYRVGPGGQMAGLSPSSIPVGVVDRLSEVLDGRVGIESLKAQVDPPSPPEMDLTNIRRNFHRTSRGVEVLTAWLAADGDQDQVNRVINRMVREDRGPDDLISGLITTSTTLASIASTLLRQSVGGLITGLLDLYPGVEDWPEDGAWANE